MSGHPAPRQLITDYLDSRLDGEGIGQPVPTGLSDLDDAFGGGLRSGETVLVTGLPGVGTSLLALGFARAAAFSHGVGALVLTQDPEDELWTRIVSAETKVPATRIRAGRVLDHDRRELEAQRERLGRAPLRVHRLFHERLDIDSVLYGGMGAAVRLVVVDVDDEVHALTREAAVSLTETARRHGVSIVVAARLPGAGPRPTDFVEVCAVHPGAAYLDTVISLDRDDMHRTDSDRVGECDVRLLRNRWGPTPSFSIALQGHFARFVSTSPATGSPRPKSM